MNEHKVIRLHQRQRGLESQIKILGKSVRVYDYRDSVSLLSLESLKSQPSELWFTQNLDDEIQCFENGTFVISGYSRQGFRYSCCGSPESDREYIALTCSEEELEGIEKAFDEKAEDIIIGRVIDKRASIAFASQYLNDLTQQKIRDFYSRTKEEQEAILQNMFKRELKRRKR